MASSSGRRSDAGCRLVDGTDGTVGGCDRHWTGHAGDLLDLGEGILRGVAFRVLGSAAPCHKGAEAVGHLFFGCQS